MGMDKWFHLTLLGVSLVIATGIKVSLFSQKGPETSMATIVRYVEFQFRNYFLVKYQLQAKNILC